MSDSHDRWDYLEQAINIANRENCGILLFTGDLVAPPGIPILEKFNGQVKFVWGNNEGERVGITRKIDASDNIELGGEYFEGKVEGLKIFMNHYPRLVELAAKSGEFDLCIFGHTHEYLNNKVNNCILLNPGEIQGYKTNEPGFVIFDILTKNINRVLIKNV